MFLVEGYLPAQLENYHFITKVSLLVLCYSVPEYQQGSKFVQVIIAVGN